MNGPSLIDPQIVYAVMTFVAATLGLRVAAKIFAQKPVSWRAAMIFAGLVTALGYYF